MKLFVSDIDGTLYWYNNKNNSGCSEECKCAIKKWLEAGNIFAIATARVYTMRDYTLEDIGSSVDYLGGNGSEFVYSNYEFELKTLPFSYFLEVGKWIDEKQLDASVKICVNKQFVAYRQDLYPFTTPERMRKNLYNSIIYDEYSITEKCEGVNMSLLCHPSLTKWIEKELQDQFRGRCNVIATDTDNIDFVPLGSGKGEAIRLLAEHYGVDMKDVIVIGDAANDVCMFELTKNSYCRSHSDDWIREKAGHVVDLVEEAIYRELAKL